MPDGPLYARHRAILRPRGGEIQGWAGNGPIGATDLSLIGPPERVGYSVGKGGVIMWRALVLLASFGLAGCVTTSMQGYADRDLPSRHVQRLAAYVAAPGPLAVSMQSTILEEARKRGISAQDALSILPPTRQYTDAEMRKALLDQGIDGVLIITVADSGVIAQYAGTFFQSTYNGSSSYDGTINRTGNMSTMSVSGTHSGTSFGSATPTYRYSRRTAFTARLIDPKTSRNLWVGNGEVNAGGGGGVIGRMLVADGVSSTSSIGAIFDDLQRKGVIGADGDS